MTDSIKIGFVFGFSLMVYSCANIVMPSGGAKDITPPVMVKSTPNNNSTNFQDDKVELTFDEFVELDAPQKNIFVSPYTPQILTTQIIGKKILLKFPEGLKKNTTYSIEFNKAIKDFNEGNYMSKIVLNFSTGQTIDSGKLMIEAKDAKHKTYNDLAITCLVKNKSDFFGKNYNYVAKSSSGIASFTNLNKEDYYAYVFVDSNANMKWERTEPIGFIKEPISQGTTLHQIKTFVSEMQKVSFFLSIKSPNEFDLQSTQEIFAPRIVDSNYLLIPMGEKNFKIISKSSSEPKKIRLNYDIDKYETLDVPKTNAVKYIERIDLEPNRGQFLKRNDTMVLNLNSYIQKMDTSKIHLKMDEKPIEKQIIINKNQLILTNLDFGKNYTLMIDSQALWCVGAYNRSFSYSFTTYPKDKFFEEISITLDPTLISKNNLCLYHLESNQLRPIKKESKLKIQKVYGEELIFHLIIDENNDGHWTTGNIEKEIQPEPYYIESIKLEPQKMDYILKITEP